MYCSFSRDSKRLIYSIAQNLHVQFWVILSVNLRIIVITLKSGMYMIAVCYYTCIITQVSLTFWLVLAYDILEDRWKINLTITECFPWCFKMVKSFENFDHILLDWTKDKVQKVLARHWTGIRSRKKKERAISVLGNESEKILACKRQGKSLQVYSNE